jgi:cysteinyl-tRNA synthetase
MAKSTGNNILPLEILEGTSDKLSKSFSPYVVRFFMMQAHYRSILDFSNDALIASEKGFMKLMDALRNLKSLEPKNPSSNFDVVLWKKRCYDAMNDDFNSPILISELFNAVKYINQIKDGTNSIDDQNLKLLKQTFEIFIFDVLGLKDFELSKSEGKLEKTVEILINLRNQARAERNFDLSDQIRDQLKSIGVQLKDGSGKTTFTLD